MAVGNLAWGSLTIPPARVLNGRADAVRQVAAAGARSVVPLVYGEVRIPGDWLNIIKHASDATKFHVQVLWAFAGDSISGIKLNGLDLPAGATATHYIDGTQTSPDSALVAAFSAQGITYTDTLAGFAYSVFTLPNAAFTGELQFTGLFKGRRVYDRRKDSTAGGSGSHRLATPSTWEWSETPALCLGDFLRSTVYGAGQAVDEASVATVAAANDATVGSPGEPRRTIGLAISSPGGVYETAEALRAYAGCFILPGGSGIKLVADADGSAVASYNHAAGTIASISPLALRDLGNSPTSVEVIYTDTSQVPWRDASAFAELPGAGTTLPYRLSQVRLPGIKRYSQARREAIERLNKLTIQDLSTTIEVFDIGIRHEPADIIEVTHPLGITSKKFRVLEPQMPSPGRWVLPLIEHDPASYSNVVETTPVYSNSGAVISDGTGGADGLSTYTATVYRQSATQPPRASGGSYTFEGDALVPPSGTTRAIPTSSATPTWATSYTFQTRTPSVAVPGPVGAGDADFASVKLLVHAVSSLADTSSLGLSPASTGAGLTFTSGATLFDAGAASLSGSGPFAYWNSRADWNLNRTAWTMEVWAYETGSSQGTLLCRRAGSSLGFTQGWAWLTYGLRARIGGVWSDSALSWARPSLNAWHHYRLVKSGSNLYMFVDGVLVASRADATSLNDVDGVLSLGVGDSIALENPFAGYIRELRITHTARSTTGFTAPSAPWPDGSESGPGWPDFVRVLQDGQGGANGLQSATPTVFQWAASIPAGPIDGATYTWATGSFGAAPSGWSLTPGASPSPGFTLWGASVQLLDSAANATTGFNWSAASITARGYAGAQGPQGAQGAQGPQGPAGTAAQQGASARVAYARVTGFSLNNTPTTFNTSGSATFPPTNTWGGGETWQGTVPTYGAGESVFVIDGIYNPSGDTTVWGLPYLAALKVGSLSAITVNTGNLNVTGSVVVSPAGDVRSTNYAPGSAGWYLGPSGAELPAAAVRGQLTAAQIDARGLVIRDGAGNPIVGAGAVLPLGYTDPQARNDNVSVGAENLLANAAFINGADGLEGFAPYDNSAVGVSLAVQPGGLFGTNFCRITVPASPSSSAGILALNGVRDWLAGQDHVITFWARAVNAGAVGRRLWGFHFNGGWNSAEVLSNPDLSTEWQWYAFRGNPTPGSSVSSGQFFLAQEIGYGAPFAAGAQYDVCALKVARGRVPTAWTAAERDNRNGRIGIVGGAITNIGAGSGTPVANSLIGINASGQLYGAGAGNGTTISNQQILVQGGQLTGIGTPNVFVDNAAVGAVNMLWGTQNGPASAPPGVSPVNIATIKTGTNNPFGLQPGEVLSLSADVWCDATCQAAGQNSTVYLYTQDSTGGWWVSAFAQSSALTPTRQSMAVQLPALPERMHQVVVGLYHQGTNSGTTPAGTVFADRLQVERGGVATQYKPGAQPGATIGADWTQNLSNRPPDDQLLNSYAVYGQNLIPNSDQSVAVTCSGVAVGYNPHGATFDIDTSYSKNYWGVDAYALPGSTTQNLVVHQNNRTAGGDAAVAVDLYPLGGWSVNQSIPVQPGLRYCFSAYLNGHRCGGGVGVCFFNVDNIQIAASESGYGSLPGGLCNRLDLYDRRFTPPMVAPAGATHARLFVRKTNTYAGYTESYLWWAGPQFEVVAPNATGPGPYQPGPVSAPAQLNALNRLGDNILGRISLAVADGIFAGTDLANGVYMGNAGLVGKKNSTTTFAIDTAGNAFFGGTIATGSATDFTTGTGVIALPDGRFRAGTADQYMRWTGSNLEIKVNANNLVRTGPQAPSIGKLSTGFNGNTATATLYLYSDGTTSDSQNWYTPTTGSIGNSYWVRFERSSGNLPSGTLDTWLQLSSTQSLSLSATNQVKEAAGVYKLSTSSSGSPIVASGDWFLYAESYAGNNIP